MIVIFDTNIWVSDLALTSNIGSAVRFFLKRQKARIVLPEIVRLETEIHLRNTLFEHINDIESSHRQLLSVFGNLKEVSLPNEKQVYEQVQNIFSNLGVSIEDFPFTLESARDSFERTINKIPPSDKSQQFKDGVLWADCISMLKQDSVFLVTDDRAFYKSRNVKLGLADELKREVHDIDNRLEIFPSLVDLLSQIKTDINIDTRLLLDAYWKGQREKVEEMAAKFSFVLDGEGDATIESMVTEKPEILFVRFMINLPCTDISNEGRNGYFIVAEGECFYNSNICEFSSVAVRRERLLSHLNGGIENEITKTAYLSAGVVIGHRTVKHSVRYKL
ncbi:PIN domain-containing protein [Alteromonadaceae bacterium BrNp21-10]|nr:PIN domain-containing protein [Alteromonadaceae bacterium BrNp21-10]